MKIIESTFKLIGIISICALFSCTQANNSADLSGDQTDEDTSTLSDKKKELNMVGSQECRSATENLVNGINSITGTEIADLQAMPMDFRTVYREPPSGIDTKLTIVITGTRPADVMMSPVLVSFLSSPLLQHCHSVGTVSLQIDRTNWEKTFGIVDQKTTQFQCVEEQQGNPPQYDWGTVPCG